MKYIFSCSVIILIFILSGESSSPAVPGTRTAERHRRVPEISVNRVKRQLYPGTNWCGPGDAAENYDDLGDNTETDKCCRTHDNCDHHIYSGEEKYGLKNDGFSTVSECKCDLEFSECLQNTSEHAGQTLDELYGGILAAPCFYFDKHGKAAWNKTCEKQARDSLFGAGREIWRMWDGIKNKVANIFTNVITFISDLFWFL